MFYVQLQINLVKVCSFEKNSDEKWVVSSGLLICDSILGVKTLCEFMQVSVSSSVLLVIDSVGCMNCLVLKVLPDYKEFAKI